MLGVLKTYMQDLYMSAHELISRQTLESIDPNPNARILDVGCDDGKWTLKIADRLGTKDVHGVEVLHGPAEQARSKGIVVCTDTLEEKWPFPNEHFDVVHSSFVIEHVAKIDHFLSETRRVLKPGGYVLTTTENGSSWHNVGAAVMGWQTFSSSCCSTKTKGLGNPFAIHRGPGEVPESQTHKVIFNYLGFKEIFEVHGYERIEMKGAGYYPLPAWAGAIDKRHAHFLLAKAHKPSSLGAPGEANPERL